MIVRFQKISILSPQKELEIPGRRVSQRPKKFKAMYEAKLEFPEGVGGWGYRANPFRRGVWKFSGTTHSCKIIYTRLTEYMYVLKS